MTYNIVFKTKKQISFYFSFFFCLC